MVQITASLLGFLAASSLAVAVPNNLEARAPTCGEPGAYLGYVRIHFLHYQCAILILEPYSKTRRCGALRSLQHWIQFAKLISVEESYGSVEKQ
jgi:hypothetical protein